MLVQSELFSLLSEKMTTTIKKKNIPKALSNMFDFADDVYFCNFNEHVMMDKVYFTCCL